MSVHITRRDDRTEWFGEVPVGWRVGRNKNAFRIVKSTVGDRSSEFDLLSLTLQGIKRRDLESGKGKFPESFDTYQAVEAGDLVFCLFDIDETPRTVGLSSLNGMVTGAYTVVRCHQGTDPRFVAYFYRNIDDRKGLRPFYTGLRKVVRPDTFLNASFPLPDLVTQTTIADFLDRETARIDQLIEKKEQLVELLSDHEFAQTSHLLTHGTGNHEEWKPSGVSWLDKIPAHWRWARMKEVCSRIIDCKNRTPPEVDESEYFVVRTSCVRSGAFDLEGGYWTDLASYQEWTRRGRPEPGDVIFTREAPVGEACIAPSDIQFCLGQRTMIYRPDTRKVLPEYLVATIYSSIGKSYIGSKTKGSTVGHLRVPEVYDFPCLLPPLDEQRLILNELQRTVGDVRSISAKSKQSVASLREFRSALITSAVTGQIDVTTWGKQGSTDRRLDQIAEEMST